MPVIMMTSIDTLYEVIAQDTHPIKKIGSPKIDASFHGLTQIALQGTSERIQHRAFSESSFKQQQKYLRDAAQVAVNIFNPTKSSEHRYRSSLKLSPLTGQLQAFDENSESSGLAYTLALALSWGERKQLFDSPNNSPNHPQKNSLDNSLNNVLDNTSNNTPNNAITPQIPIFATGSVPVDCYVKPIGHLLKKIRYACNYIEQLDVEKNNGFIPPNINSLKETPTFYIFIPAANQEEYEKDSALTQRVLLLGGKVVAINHVSEALQELMGERFDGGIFTHIDNGFSGLHAIHYEQRHLFMGREQLIDELVQKSQTAQEQSYVLNVTGVSGSGKSSAVMAGLVPRLLTQNNVENTDETSNTPLLINANWVLIRPSQFADISAIFYELLSSFSSKKEHLDLWISLLATPLQMVESIQSYLELKQEQKKEQEQAPHKTKTLWVIDQYEEIFTHNQILSSDAHTLFPLLALLVEELPIFIVTVLRTEYLASLGGHASIDMQLPRRIQAKEIERIIALQLQYHRMSTESSIKDSNNTEHRQHLDTRIKNDAIGKPLTTVSYLLQQIHEEMISNDASATTLLHQHYDAVGGIHGVMTRQAELALKEGLSEAEEQNKDALIHSFFDAFIGIDSDQNPIAKTLPNTHLDDYPQGVAQIVQAFMSKGLIIDCGRANTPKIKLAHDTLLPRLLPNTSATLSKHSTLSTLSTPPTLATHQSLNSSNKNDDATQWQRLADWFTEHMAYLSWKQEVEPSFLKWLSSETLATTSSTTSPNTSSPSYNKQFLIIDSRLVKSSHARHILSTASNTRFQQYIRESQQALVKKRVLPWLSVAIVICVACIGIWDHFFRIKISYTPFIGERYDIPFPTTTLSYGDIKNRQFHYKLQYQQGKLISLSRHNSLGSLKNDVNRDNAAQWHYEYTAKGLLLNVNSFAQNGKALQSKTYEFTPAKNIAHVRFKTHGSDTTIGDAIYQASNIEGNSQQKSLITQHRLTFDNNGYTIQRRFYNNNEQATKDATGAYGIQYYYDVRGLVSRVEYMDINNNSISIDGVHSREYTRDSEGNITSKSWLDANKNLTLNKNGYAQTTTSYDTYGNLIEKVFLEANKNITNHRNGFARATANYDHYGNQIEQQFLDATGQLTLHKWGFAQVALRYDNKGNAIEWSYFDEEGKPTLRNNSFSTITFNYDQWGNKIEENYFGLDGNPTQHPNGYARLKSSYDKHGNRLSESYHDANNALVHNQKGYAKIVSTYNAKGNAIKRAYFNKDNEATPNQYGYALYLADFDRRGNRTRVRFYDTESKLQLNQYGFAQIKMQYNEQGQKINISYYDANEKLTLHRDGIAQTRIRYDQYGNMIEAQYLGTDGKPSLRNHQFARITLRYDIRGNRISERYFGIDNEAVMQAGGYAAYTIKYDDRNNPIEWKYFDANETLTLNTKGYATLIATYDSEDNIMGTAYYDDNETLLRATGTLKRSAGDF